MIDQIEKYVYFFLVINNAMCSQNVMQIFIHQPFVKLCNKLPSFHSKRGVYHPNLKWQLNSSRSSSDEIELY